MDLDKRKRVIELLELDHRTINDIRELKEAFEGEIAYFISTLSKASGIGVEDIYIDIHTTDYEKKTGKLKTVLKVNIDMRL